MNPAVPALLSALAAVTAVIGVHRGLRTRPAGSARADSLIARHPRLMRIATALERSGAPGDPAVVVPLGGAAVVAVAALAWRIAGTPLAAAAVVACAHALTRRLVAGADRRYARRVAMQLPAVAGDLGVAVAAGLSLGQAVVRAARDAPEPVAGELRRVAGEVGLGTPVDEALDAMAERLPEPDVVLMVTAIVVQRRTGGNLARALGDLASRLDERTALDRELRGATAQARATAWLVAALPALGGLALELAAPGVMARTLGHGVGLVLLATAAALDAAGVAMVRRLAAVEA